MGHLSLSHMATLIHAISNHWRDWRSNPDPLSSLPASQELSHYTTYNCIQEVSACLQVWILPPPSPFLSIGKLVLNLSLTDTERHITIKTPSGVSLKGHIMCPSSKAKFLSPRAWLAKMHYVMYSKDKILIHIKPTYMWCIIRKRMQKERPIPPGCGDKHRSVAKKYQWNLYIEKYFKYRFKSAHNHCH